MSHPFVYLASQSPRRSQLLQQIGVAHRLLPAGADEDAEALEAWVPGELPDVYVPRVRPAQRGLEPAPVLCADTTVALGRSILGKPADAAEATDMLRRLSGRTHRVLTALAVHDGRRTRASLQVSHVRFAAMPDAAIEAYVAGGEPFGKAGAYAIQGGIAAWVAHVDGSHSGIMGLPLFETATLLRAAGVAVP
jgi:septum formation protein